MENYIGQTSKVSLNEFTKEAALDLKRRLIAFKDAGNALFRPLDQAGSPYHQLGIETIPDGVTPILGWDEFIAMQKAHGALYSELSRFLSTSM